MVKKRFLFVSEARESLDLEAHSRQITPLIGLVYLRVEEEFSAFIDEKDLEIRLFRDGRLHITGPSEEVCREEFDRVTTGLTEVLGRHILYTEPRLSRVTVSEETSASEEKIITGAILETVKAETEGYIIDSTSFSFSDYPEREKSIKISMVRREEMEIEGKIPVEIIVEAPDEETATRIMTRLRENLE